MSSFRATTGRAASRARRLYTRDTHGQLACRRRRLYTREHASAPSLTPCTGCRLSARNDDRAADGGAFMYLY